MPFLNRTRLVLSVVLAITVTALILASGCERPKVGLAKETGPDDPTKQATGKAPPIPEAGRKSGVSSSFRARMMN